MRNFLYIIPVLILCLLSKPATATGYVLMPKDSARIKVIDGKKYLLHKVEKGETFSGIAQKYKITTKQLQAANPGVTVLKFGQIIQVPVKDDVLGGTVAPSTPPVSGTKTIAQEKSVTTEKPVTEESKPAPADPVKKEDNSKKAQPVYHVVNRGETVSSISKKHKISSSDLIAWNKIKNNNIRPGQKIIVGYKEPAAKTTTTAINSSTQPQTEMNPVKAPNPEIAPKEGNNEPVDKGEPMVESPPIKREVIKTTESGKEVNQIVESGEASWVSDAELNPNKFYALHRTAPIGTIAKVTNKMNGKSVFVKVIGRLPNTGDNYNVIIKVSKASADKIGVIDEKFVAEIQYALAN